MFLMVFYNIDASIYIDQKENNLNMSANPKSCLKESLVGEMDSLASKKQHMHLN